MSESSNEHELVEASAAVLLIREFEVTERTCPQAGLIRRWPMQPFALCRQSAVGPTFEYVGLLWWPGAVAGHRSGAQALEDRVGVLADVVV